MKPKFQPMNLRFMIKMIPTVLIILITTIVFNSCQKEENLSVEAKYQFKSTSDMTGTIKEFYPKEQFVREKGKPTNIVQQIGNANIIEYESCFVLYVQNGSEGNNFVSSAVVKVDGETVLGPSDFKNSPDTFLIQLCNLNETSTLEVEIRGNPGSTLTVWIEGKSKNEGTFTDERDGKVYKWVRICGKVWMAENLAYLPNVSTSSEVSNTEPSYNVYGYQGSDVSEAKATYNYKAYGVLYNWAAAMQGEESSDLNPSTVIGISPAGWHLPSYSEWNSMLQCVGNGENPYFKLIVGGVTGFEANFSGIRGGDALYYSLGLASYIWSSTSQSEIWAYKCTIDNTVNSVYGDAAYKIAGFAVRCVKD